MLGSPDFGDYDMEQRVMSVDENDEMFDRAKLGQLANSMTPEVRAKLVT